MVWTRARRKRSVGRSGEKPPLQPAQLSAYPRGPYTLTSVWTRAWRRICAGRGGERLPLLPAAALSSSTRNQHPRNGLDPGKKEEKRRKKRRKAATSTSTALSLPTRILHPHFGLDPCKKKKRRGKKRRKAATSTSSCSQTSIDSARRPLPTSPPPPPAASWAASPTLGDTEASCLPGAGSPKSTLKIACRNSRGRWWKKTICDSQLVIQFSFDVIYAPYPRSTQC